MIDRLRLACALIVSPHGGQASGYLVARDRVATCAHVIDDRADGDTVTVRFGTRELSASILSRDVHADCAILALASPITDIVPLTLGSRCLRKASWDGFGFVDSVGTAGLPLTGEVLEPDHRDDLGTPALVLFSQQIAAGGGAVAHGLSGSPVLVDNLVVGHLKRIISDSDTPRRAALGILYATPSRFVCDLLGLPPFVGAEVPVLPIHVSGTLTDGAHGQGVQKALASLNSFELIQGQNAVVMDNATLRFALRALSLRTEGSRFDSIHVSCLQQLVEAIVLHDVILVPALSDASWLADAPVDLRSCGIHIVPLPLELDALVSQDAIVWAAEWMSVGAAQGLIARLLHIQREQWERKGLALDRGDDAIPGVDPIRRPLAKIWNEFVSYSSIHHLSAPGRVYSAREWNAWLDGITPHGLSLLHWLIYRPFYYHILAGYIWKVPYCAHPSRGLALTFDGLERKTEFAKVALAMVADLQRDFSSWVNSQLGQQLLSATMPPIFRWTLNAAETPGDILRSAVELRTSADGRAFRQWAARISSEGARNPNAAYQACIQLARFAHDVRRRWGIGGSDHDVIYMLRCGSCRPSRGTLEISGTPRNTKSLLFLRRLSDAILSVSQLSTLYEKHFWDREFNADRFDEAHGLSELLQAERKKSRRQLGMERLREEALRAAASEPPPKPPEKARSNSFYAKQAERRAADALAQIAYGWGHRS